MLRLRTTAGLSALALAIGIAGTGWLSTLTAGWGGPPSRVATTHRAAPRTVSATGRAHAAARSARPRHRPVTIAVAADQVDAAPPPAPPSPQLIPLAMPGDSSQTWDSLRGHLDGRVVLHVEIDGNGRVRAAGLLESSGDPILDAHALRSVRGWRFAVPADHPEGISGELPMRFSSRGDAIARLP